MLISVFLCKFQLFLSLIQAVSAYCTTFLFFLAFSTLLLLLFSCLQRSSADHVQLPVAERRWTFSSWLHRLQQKWLSNKRPCCVSLSDCHKSDFLWVHQLFSWSQTEGPVLVHRPHQVLHCCGWWKHPNAKNRFLYLLYLLLMMHL